MDRAMGLYWWEKAAKQGISSAQVMIGKCYEDGDDTAADQGKARYWYKKAAEQDNAAACYYLRNYSYSGKHRLSKDIAKAVEYWVRGRDAGDDTGSNNPAILYMQAKM